MFCTKNLISDYKEVDPRWIFQYYLKLTEPLEGQDVKIKSVFNEKDKVPSMCLFVPKDTEEYKFRDFSTGVGGDAVELVKRLFKIDFIPATRKIVEDYNAHVLKYGCDLGIGEFKKYSRYQVTSFEKRQWTTRDQYFWTQYNIGTRILNEYNVQPLESYTMHKETDDLSIQGLYIYGYFKKDGTLYKIYQPKVTDKKFIKVRNYIQGSEQLKGHDCLIIMSGLKDIMSLASLKVKIDLCAADSETSMIPVDMITQYQKRYKRIITLMDFDDAGIKASEKYREQYGFESVYLNGTNLIKPDMADIVRELKPKRALEYLIPKIQYAIN
jgi:5S rRNA maturation endonuclease (ribonuclease M5)